MADFCDILLVLSVYLCGQAPSIEEEEEDPQDHVFMSINMSCMDRTF